MDDNSGMPGYWNGDATGAFPQSPMQGSPAEDPGLVAMRQQQGQPLPPPQQGGQPPPQQMPWQTTTQPAGGQQPPSWWDIAQRAIAPQTGTSANGVPQYGNSLGAFGNAMQTHQQQMQQAQQRPGMQPQMQLPVQLLQQPQLFGQPPQPPISPQRMMMTPTR